jgi:hypothetical protein
MLNQESVNWKQLLRPEMVIAVCLLMLLLGCATDRTPPPVTTSQGQTKPLACSDFPPIKYNPGNPAATKESIIGVMDAHPDNPLGWARGELGDTLSTRTAISNYEAARRALRCDN